MADPETPVVNITVKRNRDQHDVCRDGRPLCSCAEAEDAYFIAVALRFYLNDKFKEKFDD